MTGMFISTGYYSNSFILNLGDKFDTSLVTSMDNMFHNVGYSATTFNLVLGNKFDMSNVKNASNMFYDAAPNTQTNFTLDLAAGDFSNITTATNYADMFNGFPVNHATIYVKDSTAQDWIINKNSSWGTNFSATNVLIK